MGADDWLRTGIGRSTPDSITVRGRDLARDLMGQVSFSELAFLLAGNRIPEPGETRLFDAALVALADHGLTPSVLAARLTWTGATEGLQGAVAAGLLGAGNIFLGVVDDTARFLAAVLADAAADQDAGSDPEATVGRNRLRSEGYRRPSTPAERNRSHPPATAQPDQPAAAPAPPAEPVGRAAERAVAAEAESVGRAVQRAVAAEIAAGRRIPGLGHPVHKVTDPRTPRLYAIAAEGGLPTPHLDALQLVAAAHAAATGKALPINGAGAAGAAWADLGFPPDIIRGFALLARAAGLIGHLAEEMAEPIGRRLWLEVEHRATYTAGPDGPDGPERPDGP
ncbi:MAG TPA: citrate/2-methylcitrate synthase [Acidimicrobiia bacterium]|nr:citrate/2-methylcitrate synthase [Acidimicrobiia bacterium]